MGQGRGFYDVQTVAGIRCLTKLYIVLTLHAIALRRTTFRI